MLSFSFRLQLQSIACRQAQVPYILLSGQVRSRVILVTAFGIFGSAIYSHNCGWTHGPCRTFTSLMRKTHRYWIDIKDAKGSIILCVAADWDGDDRRAGVAMILRLGGVLDPTSASSQCSGQDVGGTIDVDRMGASLEAITPLKKRPPH